MRRKAPQIEAARAMIMTTIPTPDDIRQVCSTTARIQRPASRFVMPRALMSMHCHGGLVRPQCGSCDNTWFCIDSNGTVATNIYHRICVDRLPGTAEAKLGVASFRATSATNDGGFPFSAPAFPPVLLIRNFSVYSTISRMQA